MEVLRQTDVGSNFSTQPHEKKLAPFLILITFLFSCKNSNELEPGQYVNISGTRLFIIPPKDFKISSNIIGLENDKLGIIQVQDLIGGNHFSNEKTFTKKAIESYGVKVFEFQELKIESFNAKFVHTQEKKETNEMKIIFGDSTFSEMVLAIFQPNNKELKNEIKKSLLSIKYDKNLKVDPLLTIYFKIDNNSSKFKFAKTSANMFLYSTNGIVKNSYENEPMVMVTTFPIDQVATKEYLMESMLNGLIQNGFEKTETKSISKQKVNGYDSYQVEVYGNMKNKKTLVYLLVLVKQDKAIGVYGVTNINLESNLIEFKKIIQNIKFK